MFEELRKERRGLQRFSGVFGQGDLIIKMHIIVGLESLPQGVESMVVETEKIYKSKYIKS